MNDDTIRSVLTMPISAEEKIDKLRNLVNGQKYIEFNSFTGCLTGRPEAVMVLKIPVIRVVRHLTKTDLKTAKAIVEAVSSFPWRFTVTETDQALIKEELAFLRMHKYDFTTNL